MVLLSTKRYFCQSKSPLKLQTCALIGPMSSQNSGHSHLRRQISDYEGQALFFNVKPSTSPPTYDHFTNLAELISAVDTFRSCCACFTRIVLAVTSSWIGSQETRIESSCNCSTPPFHPLTFSRRQMGRQPHKRRLKFLKRLCCLDAKHKAVPYSALLVRHHSTPRP